MSEESGQGQPLGQDEVLAKLMSTMEEFNVAVSKFQAASELQTSNKQVLNDIAVSSRNMVKEANRLVELNTALRSELDKQRQQVTRIEGKVETFAKNTEVLKEKVAQKNKEIEVLRSSKSQPRPIEGSSCAIA